MPSENSGVGNAPKWLVSSLEKTADATSNYCILDPDGGKDGVKNAVWKVVDNLRS